MLRIEVASEHDFFKENESFKDNNKMWKVVREGKTTSLAIT